MYDVHRHMGGSISTEFAWGVVLDHNMTHMFKTYDDVIKAMTFEGETFADRLRQRNKFLRFLDKFRILDTIEWTEELIDHSIADICAGLHEEGIDYAWLDFSINKYSKIGWSDRQAIAFIHDSFQRHRPGKVGLMLALKYESDKDQQIGYANMIKDDHIAEKLIGIDLVGDESKFNPEFYSPLFEMWNSADKITRAHVGESESHHNIRNAIELMKVSNVAHGIKIVNDKDLMKMAADQGIIFDLALTSNILTGVHIGDIHPGVEMCNNGLLITLGSDDPTQCQTTLANEFVVAKSLGFSDLMLEYARATAEFCILNRRLVQQHWL